MKSYKNYNNKIIKEDLFTKKKKKNLNILKTSINISFQNAINNKKDLLLPLIGLELITGQLAKPTSSKIAIANFNLKKNVTIGTTEAFIGKIQLNFIEKLKMLTLPAIKEINSMIKKNLDINGNYALGIKDLTILPEISAQYEKLQKLLGMDLILISSTHSNKEVNLILKSIQLPIK